MIGYGYIYGGRYVSSAGVQYLVDTYSPTAAYSLRKLSSSATVAIRVRRSSDSAEQDIGFSGNDLDTASLSSFVGANEGFIVTWYDQSGNGNDVTQSTAANQPKIVTSGSLDTIGGKASPRFDGVSDFMSRATTINATSVSFFSVSAIRVNNSVGVIHSQSNTTTSSIRTFCDSRITPNRNLFVSNTTPTDYFADLSTARNDLNQRLLSSFIDASNNMSGFDNGATGGTDTYTGTTTNNIFQLGRQSSGLTYLNGYIQEFIAFNTDESSNRTAIEADINTYYSIY